MSATAQRLQRVGSRRTCRLSHVGRRTGRSFEVTIWFMVDGDRVYLSTLNMQRNWTRNVLATPRVTLRIGPETFTGDASPVTDAAEMTRVVELLRKKYWLARLYLWFKKRPDGAFRVRMAE
jgi:deazaflavin-dependent oxidoreductase (nitroreductase family)